MPAHIQVHLCNNKLIITGPNTIADEITMGVHVKRHDMGNSHEEADVIVINQVMSAASQGYKTIHIVCDNTDVFVLFVHLYKTLNITSELLILRLRSMTNSCHIYCSYIILRTVRRCLNHGTMLLLLLTML